MGWGDELTASAQAKVLHAKTGLPVLVIGGRGEPRWSEVWEHNPHILRTPAGRFTKLRNGPGFRPYIAGKTTTHWAWQEWERLPGEIYLTEQERDFAIPYAGRILVEPHTKVPGGNKAWPWARWVELTSAAPELFVQVGAPGAAILPGVRYAVTTFRQACAVLAASKAFVGTEGALHHAAAALGVKAVVLWSEFIAPEITGYEGQTNIRHAGKPCGSRVPCETCRQSMDAITVQEVAEALP